MFDYGWWRSLTSLSRSFDRNICLQLVSLEVFIRSLLGLDLRVGIFPGPLFPCWLEDWSGCRDVASAGTRD